MRCTRREQDTRSPPHSVKYWPLFFSHGPHALVMSHRRCVVVTFWFGRRRLSVVWLLLLGAHVLRAYVSEQRGITWWWLRCSSCAHRVGQDSFLRCWHSLCHSLKLFLRAVIAATQIAFGRVAMSDGCDICVLQGLAEGIDHLFWSSCPLDDHRLSLLLVIGAIDWL